MQKPGLHSPAFSCLLLPYSHQNVLFYSFDNETVRPACRGIIKSAGKQHNRMKKPSQILLILAIVGMVLMPAMAQAQNWEKYIEKYQDTYDKGEYKKAEKGLAKLEAKSVAKLGSNNKYQAFARLHKAKVNLALGLLYNFEGSIKEAITISEAANGENSADHALNYLEASEILMEYGNFVLATEMLDKANSIFESTNQLSDALKARIGLNKAWILSSKGFYREALQIMDEQYEYLAGRAVKKETYVENGELKTRKVPDDERLRRFSQFARLLTMKAFTLHRRGDFKEADLSFIQAEQWIDNNLGRADDAWALNQYYWGLMLEENGLIPKVRADYYLKASNAMRRKYKPYHVLNLRIQQKLIKAFADNNNGAKLNREKTEYNKMSKGYYGIKSLHYLMRNALQLDLKVSKARTSGIEERAFEIINNRSILPEIHPERIRFLRFLANYYAISGNYKGAEELLDRAVEIKAELYGKDSPEYGLALINKANFIIDFGDDLKLAEEIYNKYYFGLLKDEILYGHVEYLDIQSHLAALYQSTDRYDKSYAALEEAKKAAQGKYKNTDVEYGIALDNIARLLIKIGRYSEAVAQNEQALKIFDDLKGREKNIYFSIAYETKAILYAAYGFFDEAEASFDESQRLEGKSSLTDRIESTTSVEELAHLYLEMGRFSETEDLLNEAIAEYEAAFGPNTRKLVKPLIERSRLQLISGDYPGSQRTAQRAFDIALRVYGTTSTQTANAQIQLGDVFVAIGDYEKAAENLRAALAIQQKQFGEEHVDVAITTTKLAMVGYFEGDAPEDVEKMLRKALDIFALKLGFKNPRYAETLEYIANNDIRANKTDEAFELLNKAREIWESRLGRRNNIKLAGIHESSGDIYYFRRNYQQAKDEYDKARRLYKRTFSDEHPDYVKVLSKLSKVAYMMGDAKGTKDNIDEAIANYNLYIQKYFPALSEREKAKFWNTIRPDFEYYNTLAVKLRYSDPGVLQDMYNNALTTKSLLLNSSIKLRQQILSSGDQELITQYSDWLRKKELMTKVISMSQEQLDENGINPDQLGKEIEALEKDLGTRSALFESNIESKTITWQDVQQSLKPNEVAIEMVRFRYFDQVLQEDSVLYAVLYLKGDPKSKPELLLLNNGNDLESKFKHNYRNSIKFKIEDYYSYDAFWKPIADVIGNYSTIYLSADGVYNQINLEAIPLGDGRYVLDNSNIILLSNTKDIYRKRSSDAAQLTASVKKSKSHYAIMYGNPKYYSSADERHIDDQVRSSGFNTTVSTLPGTQKEIEALRSLLGENGWKIDDYLQYAAQEDSIKQMSSPQVFHIATHGFFTPNKEFQERAGLQAAAAFSNPLLRCGLLLAGAGDLLDKTSYNYNMEPGILTAYEAMNLNLDATDLVVLSACETGLGDVQIGEGVYGLQRAFMVAGAKNLVMSLFKVSDEATQKLMEKFYEKWIQTGNMRQSFIDAKKEIRNEYEAPIYWGSFIMMGME